MIKVIKFREVFLRILLHSARRWAPEGRERLRGTKGARRAAVSRPSSIHRLAGPDVKLAARNLGESRGGRLRVLRIRVRGLIQFGNDLIDNRCYVL